MATGNIALTAFEKGFREQGTEDLRPCASMEDDGLRAGCSLLAALNAETTLIRSLGEGHTQDDFAISSDSCAYRLQRGPLLHKYASKMHPYLKQVLHKYATLHRHCTGLEYSSFADMYASNKKPQCRYVVWSCTFGLGNKLMSLLSTFLYAILSQRVLLIESPGWEHLFCEPFLGSTLQVPKGFSLIDERFPSFAEFRKSNCKALRNEPHCSSNVVEVAFTGVSRPRDHSFLVCPTAMAAVREVPILHFRNSNQHFGVGFFLNPALRPLLELLFPEHNVFHMLAQSFLSPSDAVWAKIRTFHEQFLQPASRNVGVQLRESKGEYRKYYDDVVPLCIKSKSALCPIELDEQIEKEKLAHIPSSSKSNINISRPLLSVYVSSLAGGHFESLKKRVAELEPEMRQRFVVVAQSAEGEQRENMEHIQKALLDIWMLSLSDILFTSHMSTFGYTAQGLAGITPYHLKPWLDNACWLSVSSDPCFHFAPQRVDCPADNFTMRDPFQEAPYIMKCPDLPNTGLQLSE